jgi:hypothetical protein
MRRLAFEVIRDQGRSEQKTRKKREEEEREIMPSIMI